MHAELVSNEMTRAGFRVKVITSTAIRVMLTRAVTVQEVQDALAAAFDVIPFEVWELANGGVMVCWGE